MATTRALLFIEGFLAMELLGVLISVLIWIPEILGPNEERFQGRNYALQNWWGTTIAKMGIRIYDLKFDFDTPFKKTNNSFILFIRHTSFIDTFLPIFLISSKHQIRLRYVLKEELLWGPCLNIVGNRIPNVFVRRDSIDTEHQLSEIRNLTQGIPHGDGIVLYPEGTRFTLGKRERIRDNAKLEGEESYRRALRFESVLPPRRGGALSLLNSIPNVDAVFCTHTGLESTVTPRQLLSGQLVGTTIHIDFHRVDTMDIPKNSEEQKDWLDDRWSEVDRRVTEYDSNRNPIINKANQ
jgi:1-acyl-sn-glycerol-3-phosphate acyltransferase